MEATSAVFRGAGERVIVGMCMYQRTARAAIWIETDEEANMPTAGRRGDGSPERTIWAKVPLQVRQARCIAVRCRGDQLWVAISGFTADRESQQVMTDEEATRWVATGF